MSKFSVIFFGTPDIAVPCLESLIADERFDVTHVVTQPDREVGRKKIMTAPPIKSVAERHSIPVHQPEDIDSLQIDSNPDYIVVMAYGQKLGSYWLNLPSIAAVNVHVSLLPRWRGASPIQHAIMHGDLVTGVTIQKMNERIDAGEILSQESLKIEERETSESLSGKLSHLGAKLITETLSKKLSPVTQDESKATKCKKLTRKNGELDHKTLLAEEIDRYVRALCPWPGVTLELNGNVIKVLETALEETDTSTPLNCKNNTVLHLVSVQPPGRTPMSGKDWARGLNIDD